ncbi:alcohol dehydrogenase [Sporolactobacillus sp. THM7-4]|nr:alcohol dehydrogenase [Sporolactobacillus sp. THM7-4]
MLKIRSAVITEMGKERPYSISRPLEIRELELDEPQRGEVRVQIKAAGLCHSDLSVINGSRPWPMPMALGHEAAGIVEKVGPGVRDLLPGDHVACVFKPGCGHCLPCREGRPGLCVEGGKANQAGTLLGGGMRLHDGDRLIYHHLGISAFSDHIVASERSLVKIDPGVPFEKAALFGCAVLTGVGEVVNTAGVKLGSTAAIVGLGGVGLSALMGVVASGAGEIIALDINDSKLEFAKKLGATHVFNSKNQSVIEEVKRLTDGGVDYAFETAGAVPAMEVAYQITRPGGETITSGLPHPDAKFSFPQVTLAAEERTIKGSYLGSCVPDRDIPRFIKLFRQDRLPVDQLLSKVIPLEEINEGFELLAAGQVNRVVVIP